jgi:cytidine deaminase
LEIRIHIEEYESPEGLGEKERELVLAARKAAGEAYAPYSNFHVGAAVLLENGDIIHGNNQENAAYPDGLCAERVALFSANASQPESPVLAIAVTALTEDGYHPEPVYPCGSCRQSLLEAEQRFGRPVRILMCGESGIHVASSVRDLLPLSFDASFLKKQP